MSLSELFENVNMRREVVACYFVPAARAMIVTGVGGGHNGGAIVLDDAGQYVRSCGTKREALASIISQ